MRGLKLFQFAGLAGLALLLSLPSIGVAAVVSSVSQTQGLDFGTFDPNNNGSGTGGTIATNACAVTGSVKSITTCTNASFLVSGTNNSSGSNRNQIRVRILNPSTTLKSGSNSMTISFSFSSSSAVTSMNYNLSGVSGGAGTVSVPVYSTITVSGTQQSGVYNQNSTGGSGLFTFVACNNNLACTS